MSIKCICFQGDSGGPLVCRDLSDTWRLFGVMSHIKPGCTAASVYKMVPYFRKWIDEQIELHPSDIKD